MTGQRLESPRFLLTFWFCARLLVVGVWAATSRGPQGDVLYYFDHIHALGQAGAAQTMPEYPTPALLVLALPYLLSFGSAAAYSVAFACLMLALDAGFTYTLWRTGGRWRGQAVIVWTLFLAFIGPTAYLRFDLVTSVLIGWSLILALRQRHFWSGLLIGLGAAIKLWPALVWPAVCSKAPWRTTLGALLSGAPLAVASLLWAGWDRLVSPLTYQSDRGLQVESVFASVPMLARGLHIGDYAVTVSRYQAFEIWGTGRSFWLAAAQVASIVGYVLIVAVYVLWYVRGNGSLLAGCVLTLLVITTLIVTNKTFSPQYVIWLGGPLAATILIAGTGESPAVERRLTRLTWQILALALATLVIYPLGYSALVQDTTAWWHTLRLPVTLVLVARNALVVWLLLQLIAWATSFLRLTAPRRPGDD